MNKLTKFFREFPNKIKGYKKITVFLLGILTVFLQDVIGLTPETVQEIIAVVSVYLVSQGISDNGSDRPTK